MGFRAEILCGFWAASFLVVSAPGHAETNAASPWRGNTPGLAQPRPPTPTNAVATTTEAKAADANEFFAKYKEAVRLVEQGQTQDAAITMDLLSRSLSSSPWMEIAMLKHCQLIEQVNEQAAEEGYLLLRQRILNAPYFQGNAERARVFGVALQGAVDAGITRLRIRRVRLALEAYRAKYLEYPESLAKLAILGYTEMENTHDTKDQALRYVPAMPQLTPFISYKRYEGLEAPVPDPFVATAPRLESTSLISEEPLRYSALIRLPGRAEPARLEQDQTVQGYFIAAISSGGAVVSTPTHVLVLVAP